MPCLHHLLCLSFISVQRKTTLQRRVHESLLNVHMTRLDISPAAEANTRKHAKIDIRDETRQSLAQ